MNWNNYLGYCKTAFPFLAAWFGAQIFGLAVWHFVVVDFERWLSHGAAGDTTAGLVGAAVFVAVKEANKAKSAAAVKSRREQLAQFVERARSRKHASRGAE